MTRFAGTFRFLRARTIAGHQAESKAEEISSDISTPNFFSLLTDSMKLVAKSIGSIVEFLWNEAELLVGEELG